MWLMEVEMKGSPAYVDLQNAGWEPFHFVMVEGPRQSREEELLRAGGSQAPQSMDLYPVVGMRKWAEDEQTEHPVRMTPNAAYARQQLTSAGLVWLLEEGYIRLQGGDDANES